MKFLFLGALGLVVLLLLLRGYTRASPHALAQGLRIALILVSLAAGIALIATGRWGFVILPIAALAAAFAGGRRRPVDADASAGSNTGPRGRASGAMSRAEALKVLGLQDGASEDDILAAYRKLIMQNHPDRGGSTYLAAKINQAKDVLLGK